jgi:hypothetical protein
MPTHLGQRFRRLLPAETRQHELSKANMEVSIAF